MAKATRKIMFNGFVVIPVHDIEDERTLSKDEVRLQFEEALSKAIRETGATHSSFSVKIKEF